MEIQIEPIPVKINGRGTVILTPGFRGLEDLDLALSDEELLRAALRAATMRESEIAIDDLSESEFEGLCREYYAKGGISSIFPSDGSERALPEDFVPELASVIRTGAQKSQESLQRLQKKLDEYRSLSENITRMVDPLDDHLLHNSRSLEELQNLIGLDREHMLGIDKQLEEVRGENEASLLAGLSIASPTLTFRNPMESVEDAIRDLTKRTEWLVTIQERQVEHLTALSAIAQKTGEGLLQSADRVTELANHVETLAKSSKSTEALARAANRVAWVAIVVTVGLEALDAALSLGIFSWWPTPPSSPPTIDAPWAQ